MSLKPKILIVDDNISNILVIEELLDDPDIELVRAKSGLEAIEKTRHLEFALILMDVQMPGMDGFETVEIIRQDEKNFLLPIIYITAIYNENYYRTKGIKTGAVDFIAKPIIPDLFIGKVTLFVNLYKQRISLEQEVQKRKEAEEEMKLARDQAREAAHAKQLFLSTMSHEIRTPLNAIVNTANLLKEENPREDQLENIEILEFSAENLLHLINDILDFSKIDAGKIEFEAIEFEIRKLMNGIHQSFEYQATQKDISLEFTVAPDVPAVIIGDSARLSQILINLIGNAVKFTDRGRVIIETTLHASRGKEVELILSVSDTGIGIPEDKVQFVFESFTQASSSTTRKYGGTGLGLAITRKLVEMQGGSIEIKSKVGEGSTFWIELPQCEGQVDRQERLTDSTKHNIEKSGLSGTLLYIEDNQSNIELVKKILAEHRPEMLLISGTYGKNALQLALDHKPGLVLLDLNLPDMHGSEVLVLLKSNIKTMEIPVVVLSADAMSGQIKKMLKSGALAYLTKPLDVIEFLRVIDLWMNTTSET